MKYILHVLALICASLMVGTPTHSQNLGIQAPGGSSANKNWMYEYVSLRIYAANVQFANYTGPVGKIVGGKPATNAQNPFQVGLMNKSVPNNFNAQFCGGSLIKPNVVVTAAHCSDFVKSNHVQVLTGTRNLDGTGTRHNVSRIVIHPRYNAVTFDYDVAVWHLSSSASGIQLATLASADGSVGNDMLTTGWGALSEGGAFPVRLHVATVPLVDRGDCNDANSYNGAITSRMLCAGLTGGGKDACQGDSGGPIAVGNSLRGITSWGIGCARPNFFGVYARISNPSIRSFIEAND